MLGQRLLGKHIEPGAAEPSGSQSFAERPMIDEAGPRHVDDQSARGESRHFGAAQQQVGPIRERRSQNHDVGDGQN